MHIFNIDNTAEKKGEYQRLPQSLVGNVYSFLNTWRQEPIIICWANKL